VPQVTGGPGTSSPGLFTAKNAPLLTLLLNAYGKRPWELIAPDWLSQSRFDVSAKIPPEATKAQVNEMLQNLLVERFGLVVHKETRPLASYELTVGSGGPRIHSVAVATDADQFNGAAIPGVRTLPKDAEGWPVLPADAKGIAASESPAGIRYAFRAQPISQLVSLAERVLAAPVIDATALGGRYDFDVTMNIAAERAAAAEAGVGASARDPALIIVNAVSALGFKLHPVKAPREVIVVDRINRTPTEN